MNTIKTFLFFVLAAINVFAQDELLDFVGIYLVYSRDTLDLQNVEFIVDRETGERFSCALRLLEFSGPNAVCQPSEESILTVRVERPYPRLTERPIGELPDMEGDVILTFSYMRPEENTEPRAFMATIPSRNFKLFQIQGSNYIFDAWGPFRVRVEPRGID